MGNTLARYIMRFTLYTVFLQLRRVLSAIDASAVSVHSANLTREWLIKSVMMRLTIGAAVIIEPVIYILFRQCR